VKECSGSPSPSSAVPTIKINDRIDFDHIADTAEAHSNVRLARKSATRVRNFNGEVAKKSRVALNIVNLTRPVKLEVKTTSYLDSYSATVFRDKVDVRNTSITHTVEEILRGNVPRDFCAELYMVTVNMVRFNT
jgi:enamine deaminase RidA (YjgF/YER057c/UK114 family)